jgi:hypothetical protein
MLTGGESVQRGRKSKYDTVIKPNWDKIEEMLKNGMDEKDIARHFGIAPQTFCEYKQKFPEFREFVIECRQSLIDEVKKSLAERARGYRYIEKKEILDGEGNITRTEVYYKEALPDINAATLLLLNCDESFSKDPAGDRLKREEFEWKKKVKEDSKWE